MKLHAVACKDVQMPGCMPGSLAHVWQGSNCSCIACVNVGMQGRSSSIHSLMHVLVQDPYTYLYTCTCRDTLMAVLAEQLRPQYAVFLVSTPSRCSTPADALPPVPLYCNHAILPSDLVTFSRNAYHNAYQGAHATFPCQPACESTWAI